MTSWTELMSLNSVKITCCMSLRVIKSHLKHVCLEFGMINYMEFEWNFVFKCCLLNLVSGLTLLLYSWSEYIIKTIFNHSIFFPITFYKIHSKSCEGFVTLLWCIMLYLFCIWVFDFSFNTIVNVSSFKQFYIRTF